MLQILVNALALGASYALLALGFVLILNATSAVNFTHGDMVMAGGYVTIALFSLLPLPGVLLLPAVMLVMALEREFKGKISDEEAARFCTVEEVVDYVSLRIGEQGLS